MANYVDILFDVDAIANSKFWRFGFVGEYGFQTRTVPDEDVIPDVNELRIVYEKRLAYYRSSAKAAKNVTVIQGRL